MAGFKYPYTCDLIDKEIGHSRTKLYECATDLFNEFNVKATNKDKLDATEILFSGLSDFFENTRQINIDMRGAANQQIVDLDEENIELRAEIYKLQKRIKELEKIN